MDDDPYKPYTSLGGLKLEIIGMSKRKNTLPSTTLNLVKQTFHFKYCINVNILFNFITECFIKIGVRHQLHWVITYERTELVCNDITDVRKRKWKLT